MAKIMPPATAPATVSHHAYMDRMLAATDSILAYHGPVRIRFGEKPGQAVTVSRQNREAAISNVTSFLYFQEGTGQLVKTRLYEAASRGMKARRLVYPIHTGSLLGWPTKIMALVVSLIAASLPVTGLYIWLHRKKKTSRQKTRKQDRSPLLRKDSVSFPTGI